MLRTLKAEAGVVEKESRDRGSNQGEVGRDRIEMAGGFAKGTPSGFRDLIEGACQKVDLLVEKPQHSRRTDTYRKSRKCSCSLISRDYRSR